MSTKEQLNLFKLAQKRLLMGECLAFMAGTLPDARAVLEGEE